MFEAAFKMFNLLVVIFNIFDFPGLCYEFSLLLFRKPDIGATDINVFNYFQRFNLCW